MQGPYYEADDTCNVFINRTSLLETDYKLVLKRIFVSE
jgi:hypothetical protein